MGGTLKYYKVQLGRVPFYVAVHSELTIVCACIRVGKRIFTGHSELPLTVLAIS